MNSTETREPESHSAGPRPAPGVSFALIDRTPVVFSEDAQKLFELNEVAAFIWCSLQEAMPLELVCEQLVQRGISPIVARSSLQDALTQWLSAGLLVPQFDAADFAFTAMIGRKRIEVRASDTEMLGLLRSLFVTTSPSDGQALPHLTVHRLGNTAIVMHDGRKVLDCAINTLAPTFRAYVIQQFLLAGDGNDVIFHAAAVTSQGRGMLISAAPGTGKSTLTMHLINAGLGFATDDIVLIAPDGEIRGAPFAPTLKSGAWPLVETFRPDAASAVVHDRMDGKTIRYLDVEPSFHDEAIRVNWIVFLDRAPSRTRPVLTELTELDTLQRIVDASFACNGKLTVNGFRTLKTIVSQTRSFVLHYHEATQATDKLIELCNGNS